MGVLGRLTHYITRAASKIPSVGWTAIQAGYEGMLAKKLEFCEPTSITATVRYISFRGFAALKGAAWDITIAVGLVY